MRVTKKEYLPTEKLENIGSKWELKVGPNTKVWWSEPFKIWFNTYRFMIRHESNNGGYEALLCSYEQKYYTDEVFCNDSAKLGSKVDSFESAVTMVEQFLEQQLQLTKRLGRCGDEVK